MTPQQRLTAHRRTAAMAEEAGYTAWMLGDYRGAIRNWHRAARHMLVARKIEKGVRDVAHV